MEIKIINMKKMSLLSVMLFFVACNVTNREEYVQNFKKEFKFTAYCSCLLQGYNSKILTSQITHIDKSFYSPIITSIFSEELIRIGIEEDGIMKKDSLKSINYVSEAIAGKKIQLHCLNFLNSKKLDSLTNLNYKKWKNIKKIDSLLNIKNPGF
jgi:hypothetical protein